MDQQKQRGIASAVEALNRHIRSKEISDFRIDKLEGETLTLVGSFDLSYYHDMALVITGVSSVNLSCCFWVDLSEPHPFSAAFPSEDTAVLSFTDCGARRRGEIAFEGDVSLQIEHVSYFKR